MKKRPWSIPSSSAMYGGWKASAMHYEDQMLSAPSPDHPTALDAFRKLIVAEANMIGWASRS